ncbi:uncharacterized protein isoform X2 [Rhodnius prolixus]
MWLFGSGKKKSAPEVFISGTTTEGFTQVSAGPPEPVSSITSYESPIPPYPTLPYSLLPQAPYVPPRIQPTVRPPANPLDSIPFRLAKEFQQDNTNAFDINLVKETLDKITQNLDTNAYDYDFKLEKSVIQEVDFTMKSN